MSRNINTDIERKLYAESMGKCMNPECCEDLFKVKGDIMEKAHIVPFRDTKDNSFENLVILCPNCHTNFDKNAAFTEDEVAMWKKKRQEEFNSFFCVKYQTFDELRRAVVPLFSENKTIFEQYYLQDKKVLWDSIENKVIVNNRKLSVLLENNMHLIQTNRQEGEGNQREVQIFLLHVNEFESTRCSDEKLRHVLFPPEMNSIFGICPVEESIFPSVEALENLISKLKIEQKFIDVILGVDKPYISIIEDGINVRIYLDDAPRMMQMYYNYRSFRAIKVRLESLNFAFKYIKSKGFFIEYFDIENLREIKMNGVKIVFIYVYCLSKSELIKLLPEENSVIVNLHNWNGSSCISGEAHTYSKEINVKLLTMEGFYKYVNQQKYKR